MHASVTAAKIYSPNPGNPNLFDYGENSEKFDDAEVDYVLGYGLFGIFLILSKLSQFNELLLFTGFFSEEKISLLKKQSNI